MEYPVQHSDTEDEEDFLYCSTDSQQAEQQEVSSCAAITDAAVKGPGTEHQGPEDIGDFDCPICLDLLVDPVVGETLLSLLSSGCTQTASCHPYFCAGSARVVVGCNFKWERVHRVSHPELTKC